MAIDLKKVEKIAPELLKKAQETQIQLKKANLDGHTAQVALVLDVSGSMEGLYRSNQVHKLVERVMPVALGFDDNGEIDVFAFGSTATEIGGYGLESYKTCVPDVLSKTKWSGTRYEAAINLIMQHYKGATTPVYVIFVTDGETESESAAEKAIRAASGMPIFFQFVGLGEDYDPKRSKPVAKGFLSSLFSSNGGSPSGTFKFLMRLDEMEGREVDNAGFFAIKNPTALEDSEFYELLMSEYPNWLKEVKAKGILR